MQWNINQNKKTQTVLKIIIFINLRYTFLFCLTIFSTMKVTILIVGYNKRTPNKTISNCYILLNTGSVFLILARKEQFDKKNN